MICTSNRMVNFLLSTYFCIDDVKVGDPVFECKADNRGMSVCSSFKEKKGGFVGISLSNVIDIDLCTRAMPHNAVCRGSKIEILTNGWIVYKLNPKWKIPCGQKLYCCPESGEITWRKSDIKIGKAGSKQDEGGYIRININL